VFFGFLRPFIGPKSILGYFGLFLAILGYFGLLRHHPEANLWHVQRRNYYFNAA
jgi:hypothetical protein